MKKNLITINTILTFIIMTSVILSTTWWVNLGGIILMALISANELVSDRLINNLKKRIKQLEDEKSN